MSCVLAVFRHPTPYRDPLLDRIAALGVDLEVMYLAEGFAQTPWDREPLRHRHAFARALWQRHHDGFETGFHPGVLGRLVRRRPRVVVVSGWADETSLLTAAACRLLRIPYVLGGESWELTGRSGVALALRRALLRAVMSGARAWLPCGSRARDHFVRLGADTARCHLFPTAPDAERWARVADELRALRPAPRERLGLPRDGVVAFVGRLVEDKAPDVLLDAFALLRGRRPGTRLVMVGEGPLRTSLEAHPVAPHVDWKGFLQQRDVALVLAASDVLVLPSRYETWGAVATEAMACGLPVVLSDRVGSAPDLLGAGGPGSVAPAGDAHALAAAVEAVLDLPDRRGDVARRARERALAWGHDLAARSFVRALRDAGASLPPAALEIARE
jgi:glycosyltransferase involved in cell wall biosynthesis